MTKLFLKLFLIVILISLVFSYPCFSSVDGIKQDITSAIKSYIEKSCPEFKDSEIKVEFKYSDDVFKSLLLKEGKLSYEVAPLYARYKPVGNALIPLLVFEENKEAEKIYVKAKVEVIKSVVIAKKTIKRRQLIKNEDIAIEPRDIAKFPTYFLDEKDVSEKETTTLIMANAIIEKAMIRQLPLIRRDQAIDIIAVVNNLRVKASGKALEDGYLDQVIKVINLNTKKRLSAKVISSSEVEAKTNK